MTLTAVMVGMIAIISQLFLRSLWFRSFSHNRDRENSEAILMIIGVVLAILAPIVVHLIQLAISRKREYAADASAVKFIRSPTGLINALKKIGEDVTSEEEQKTINKAVAPLFVADPFRERFKELGSTHPPLKKRIELLERM